MNALQFTIFLLDIFCIGVNVYVIVSTPYPYIRLIAFIALLICVLGASALFMNSSFMVS